ncbi:hypothetical protein TorRG33x02_258740 [Trema orientale]|uniref:RNase H type-1 domain-containing protein n=1 Tax=Trema orientale TaxID=63057 RepID=A0A2P5D8Q8_TREOI|nr:hypothetical protein TorRG33x02_258740 [Trema orientale]
MDKRNHGLVSRFLDSTCHFMAGCYDWCVLHHQTSLFKGLFGDSQLALRFGSIVATKNVFPYWYLDKSRSRNHLISENLRPPAADILELTSRILHSYQSCNMSVILPPKPAVAVDWVPPNGCHLKMNSDSAFLSETGAAGFGVVIRNASGEVLYFASGPLAGVSSVLHSMLNSGRFREGLLLAQVVGFVVQTVESDFKGQYKPSTQQL